MKILITICARGGSKGIPGKNIKLLDGKPLIYYSLKMAELFATNYDADIFLSTDSDKIIETVNSLQINKINTEYIRPDFLSTDNAGKIDAIIDVKKYAESTINLEYDYVLDLDVTAPLRTLEDLEDALKTLQASEAYNIFSVSHAKSNPYFNMVEKNDEGYFDLCKKGTFLSRQTAPSVYEMNASFYIYDKSFFEAGFKSAITPKSLIYVMPHHSFDVDIPLDFDFMEYVISQKKLDFELYS